ncbi:hypothetical protein AGABI2DRAFT_193534 [Agaricus bisporus var. bisporus H97]|uniref:hypothetical protein n=1 Tax=Agaricus bisporus var. bisporus (strain H97 / ATCC MYA-4626 / FGSC 10389) TaxID=936046 RepID=UPI00029F5225|nr:hypothetical protein AGABI2DRAFT_193534 [Agaricus bisporus var. bisporus H97]EKV45554.1 hypothetical protein AGABI2DRAFT_193534 [Agaricus bisporus var. bisporus H97]
MVVEKSNNNPQIWQIKQMDNTNYIIATDNTMEEEFRVAWSLANLTKSYSSQSSAPAPGTICLKNPGKTFALNPKKGEGEKNAICSIKVSDGSSDFTDSFVTVNNETVMAQSSSVVEPFNWQFVCVDENN